jgi:hypothetical protein
MTSLGMVQLADLHTKDLLDVLGGDDLGTEHSTELGKQTYGGCRRWLPMDHVFRRDEMKDHFNGQIERRGVPNREEGVATTSLCRRPIEVRQRIRSMESCRA